jgi:hypothetical protein
MYVFHNAKFKPTGKLLLHFEGLVFYSSKLKKAFLIAVAYIFDIIRYGQRWGVGAFYYVFVSLTFLDNKLHKMEAMISGCID